MNSELHKKAVGVTKILKKIYPDATCELNFRNSFELLVATILSAQCTDKKVNIVTPRLFNAFPTSAKMAKARISQVEKYIHSLGLFRTKAKNIVQTSKQIEQIFNGNVPQTIKELITLPGVGRKTANCVLVNAFGQPGIMADTHCIRLSNRLGLVATNDATKVEIALKQLIPLNKQVLFSHGIILHGRRVCHARRPECVKCALIKLCEYYINMQGEIG